MTDRETRFACPDPSTLAAFAEGALDAQSRQLVEQHVADCPECPVVIAETLRFLQDEVEEADAEPEPLTPHRRWWWVAAAAAAFTLSVLVWQQVRNDDPLRELKHAAAQAPHRLVEGRLAGFGHAPYSSVRSESDRRAAIEVRAAAERIADRDGTDARALHARGIAHLMSGNPRNAVALLSRAANASPQNADLWNDLAAASMADQTPDGAHLKLALAAADRAIALAPDSPPAHFNRALALYRLGRYADAANAYQRVVDLEPASPWSEEAKAQVSRLRD